MVENWSVSRYLLELLFVKPMPLELLERAYFQCSRIDQVRIVFYVVEDGGRVAMEQRAILWQAGKV